MVIARVRLDNNGPSSFSGRGRRLSKGESIVVTDESDIRYFQTAGGFVVSIERGAQLKPPPKRKSEPSSDPAPVSVSGPATPKYARHDLQKQTKGSLIKLGIEMGLELDASMAKASVVDAILKSQR